MAMPKTGVQLSGEGYYIAQIYDPDTEELEPPTVMQIFRDKKSGMMNAAWLGLDGPMTVPKHWVIHSKIEMPEPLVADLTS